MTLGEAFLELRNRLRKQAYCYEVVLNELTFKNSFIEGTGNGIDVSIDVLDEFAKELGLESWRTNDHNPNT